MCTRPLFSSRYNDFYLFLLSIITSRISQGDAVAQRSGIEKVSHLFGVVSLCFQGVTEEIKWHGVPLHLAPFSSGSLGALRGGPKPVVCGTQTRIEYSVVKEQVAPWPAGRDTGGSVEGAENIPCYHTITLIVKW